MKNHRTCESYVRGSYETMGSGLHGEPHLGDNVPTLECAIILSNVNIPENK